MESEQADAIAYLSDPANHDGAPVESIATHCARIFLAGSRAYKMKRAVRYPFLDFSSLAKRHWALARELAVNRRTAPMLYRRVRPIVRRANGTLAFGSGGAIVEWVLEMRRFDQAGLLDRLARRGPLDPAIVDDLADAVARLHAEAVPAPEHGGPPALARLIEIADQALARDRRGLVPAADRAAILDGLRREADRWADTLRARQRDGFVRQGHGDLHLRNVCLIDGRPVPFDALEFDPFLSAGDVLYDLAFLLMDLEQRDQRIAANRLLNRYLARTGDFDGCVLLGLYLALRATIRCYVALSSKNGGEAQCYAAAALRDLQPAAPRLIAVGGLSGSGKSTVAQALAPAVPPAPGAILLRTDVLRKQLWGADLFAPLPVKAYAREVSDRVYGRMFDLARRLIAGGRPVILDGVFLRAGERAAAAGLADALGVRFQGLWLDVDPDSQRARVEARRNDASDAGIAVARAQRRQDPGQIDWPRLASAGALPETLRRAHETLALPEACERRAAARG